MSKVTLASYMFYNCSNLKYLNINNFVRLNNIDYNGMFELTSSNLVICGNEAEITKLLKHPKECSIFYCSNDWRAKIKKINSENDMCVERCKNINKYEYNTSCYNDCSTFDNLSMIIKDEENYCGKNYPRETPFLILDENNCIESCGINDIIPEILC